MFASRSSKHLKGKLAAEYFADLEAAGLGGITSYRRIVAAGTMTMEPREQSGERTKGIIAALALLAVLLTGCSATRIAAEQANVIDPPAPEKTVSRFIDAANEMDISGMLDCCTLATQGSYGMLVKTLGAVMNGIGIPGIDFVSLLSNDEYVEGMTTHLKGTYGIEILDMSVEYADDQHATATCNCRLYDSLPTYFGEGVGQTYSQVDVLVVPLVFEGDDWRVDATEELMGASFGLGAASELWSE